MKKIVMLGPAADQRGGIASVVAEYGAAGLFDRRPVQFVSTHCSGGAAAKAIVAASGIATLALRLALRRVAAVHVLIASDGSYWRKSTCCALARTFGVPYVVHVHGALFDAFHADAGPRLKRHIEALLGRAALVLALSPSWKHKLQAIAPAARVAALANPIRPAAFTAAAARDPDSLLFLGEISPRKGIAELVQAFARLRAQRPQLRLRVGGTGDMTMLERAASACGVRDGIDVLGWVAGEAKQELLARATVLAVPSFQEGQPMVILEAMVAGLPVVASRVGGIPDTIDNGVDGMLIDAGDVDQLTAALARVLDDRVFADALAHAARRRVEREFAAEAVVGALLDHYRELGFISKEAMPEPDALPRSEPVG